MVQPHMWLAKAALTSLALQRVKISAVAGSVSWYKYKNIKTKAMEIA